MSSRALKKDKERWNNNKKVRTGNISTIKTDQLFIIPITTNTIAKVKSHTTKIDEDEVRELVQDLFHVKKSFKLGETIDTNSCCNVMFNLKYCGARLVNDIQEACFLVC